MGMPCVVNDIRPYLLYEYKNKENKFAIGSVSRDRFIEVDESKKNTVMQAIDLMDGSHSYEEIEQTVKNETGANIDAENLYSVLEKAGLLAEKDASAPSRSEFETLGLKLFETGITGLRSFFRAMSHLTFPTALLTAAAVIFTVVFGIVNSRYVSSVSLLGFEGHYVRNIVTIVLIMGASIMLHEFAHGITASKYGIVPQKISVSLYLYVSPIVYIKLPGLYTIRPRERISVWLAGVTVNALLLCTGFISAIILNQNGASEFAVSAMNYLWYVNLVFIVVNLCPLMPLDGYFVLATLLKIPNLRSRSFASIRNSIRNKSVQMTPGQLLYFLLSVIAMGYIFLKEIMAMAGIFAKNLDNGIGSAFWSVKHYVLLIALIITVKLVRARKIRRESI